MHSRTSLLVACLLALACAPCVALAQDATPAADVATADLAPRLDPNAPDPAPPHPELAGVFQDFGGRPGLDALMEDFMANLLADPRTAPYFETKELPRGHQADSHAHDFSVRALVLAGEITLTWNGTSRSKSMRQRARDLTEKISRATVSGPLSPGRVTRVKAAVRCGAQRLSSAPSSSSSGGAAGRAARRLTATWPFSGMS